jgi:hypothetical protein
LRIDETDLKVAGILQSFQERVVASR